jgi:hypothetical protein
VATFLGLLALDMHISDSRVSRKCWAYDTMLGCERATPDRVTGRAGGESQCLRFGTGVRRPWPRGLHVLLTQHITGCGARCTTG